MAVRRGLTGTVVLLLSYREHGRRWHKKGEQPQGGDHAARICFERMWVGSLLALAGRGFAKISPSILHHAAAMQQLIALRH
jgi:hypothetical protein